MATPKVKTTTEKPQEAKREGRYALKMRQPIEATHPHHPVVAWCNKCR